MEHRSFRFVSYQYTAKSGGGKGEKGRKVSFLKKEPFRTLHEYT